MKISLVPVVLWARSIPGYWVKACHERGLSVQWKLLLWTVWSACATPVPTFPRNTKCVMLLCKCLEKQTYRRKKESTLPSTNSVSAAAGRQPCCDRWRTVAETCACFCSFVRERPWSLKVIKPREIRRNGEKEHAFYSQTKPASLGVILLSLWLQSDVSRVRGRLCQSGFSRGGWGLILVWRNLGLLSGELKKMGYWLTDIDISVKSSAVLNSSTALSTAAIRHSGPICLRFRNGKPWQAQIRCRLGYEYLSCITGYTSMNVIKTRLGLITGLPKSM